MLYISLRPSKLHPPYRPVHSHSGHGRNFSVPNVSVYGPPSTSSSSDSPEVYGNGAPGRPMSRNAAAAIASMPERDRELGNRAPGGLGLSGVPSVQTRTPGPYHSQTPICPRPPSRLNINSITPMTSTSSTDNFERLLQHTYSHSTGTDDGTDTSDCCLCRESSESAGSVRRRYRNGSSVPGITIEPPSRPKSAGTVMTTATVPIFIEQHTSQGSMSPGVVPLMLPGNIYLVAA